MNQRKNTFLLAAILFVTLGLIVFYTLRLQSLSAKIVITAVPNVSLITINGKPANQGTNRVAPGIQTVSVSLDGFNTYTQAIELKNGENKPINVVLVSNSSRTADWYITHPKDAKAAEAISDHEVDELGNQSVQNAPLIQFLPFVSGGLEFRVDYGNRPGANANKPVIYITAPGAVGQQAGVAWIQSLGFNPKDYPIEYVTGTVQPLGP